MVLNCDFSYQRIYCLFITFKYYFHCITQIKSLQNWKVLSAFDFHRFFRFPVLTIMSFTKKLLLRKNFRSKLTFYKKRFLSFPRTDNVQSYITTIRALKIDENGPGFPLEEYSKHFLQVYLISHLLKKQWFRFLTLKLSQPRNTGIVFHFLFFFSDRRSCFRRTASKKFNCNTGTVLKNLKRSICWKNSSERSNLKDTLKWKWR